MAGTRKKTRLDRVVDLQEQAIKDWSECAQNTAKLLTKGSLKPEPWMEEYTRYSKAIVKNLGELVRIISDSDR